MLRGINVSGQKMINMAELKLLYEVQGFENVVTYIQSGNVIFNSDVMAMSELTSRIEKAIAIEYGFAVPVVIRTHKEFKNIIEACPFADIDLEKDGTKVLVAFLSSSPDKAKVDALIMHVHSPELLVINDKEVYLYCPNGYGKSKLSNNFIESKLGQVATTRNWKSVLKLYDLSMG